MMTRLSCNYYLHTNCVEAVQSKDGRVLRQESEKIADFTVEDTKGLVQPLNICSERGHNIFPRAREQSHFDLSVDPI